MKIKIYNSSLVFAQHELSPLTTDWEIGGFSGYSQKQDSTVKVRTVNPITLPAGSKIVMNATKNFSYRVYSTSGHTAITSDLTEDYTFSEEMTVQICISHSPTVAVTEQNMQNFIDAITILA